MMKIRALLLLALMIGGAYVMYQTNQNDNPKKFSEILDATDAPFNSMTFIKPIENGQSVESWVVDEPKEIDVLLNFLQHYHVRKLQPEEVNINDDINHFSIQLHDEDGRALSIMLSEDLIIQDDVLYYEITNGPLDVNWLLSFFINNQ